MKKKKASGSICCIDDGEWRAESDLRTLIEAEPASAILSDDALVDLLRAQGFDLARRTVAKYREAMGIGSSVQRRRARKLAAL